MDVFAASDAGLITDSCGCARETRIGYCGMALLVLVIGVVKSLALAQIFGDEPCRDGKSTLGYPPVSLREN